MNDSDVHEPPVNDRQLLLNIQKRDEQALAELIRRYQKRLYQLTLRVCGDGSLAEEATVESFYKIWRKAHQWQDDRSPGAWIYQIAVRTVLDLRRGRQRWRKRLQRAGMAMENDSPPDLIEKIVAAEHHEHISHELQRAIETLKTEDRVLVHMFYFENRRLREIATIMDTTPDALKMRLSRARKRLRQVLKEFDDE